MRVLKLCRAISEGFAVNPPSAAHAAREARMLMDTPAIEKRERHLQNSTKRRLSQRAEYMADQIWRRFQVGVWRWQWKHVRWFFEHEQRGSSENTLYFYRLAAVRVLRATNKTHLASRLQAVAHNPGKL